jgi:hypothetical protein
MEVKTFIGIDIGQKGGICIMKPDGTIETFAIPLTKEGQLDIVALVNKLFAFNPHQTYVAFEYITPLHFASKKANWSLAHQSGAIQAVCTCLNLPYYAVPPKIWQKKMFEKLPPMRDKKGSLDTKLMALAAVKVLYPDLDLRATQRCTTPHDGIVDSILICEYLKQNKQ